MIIHCNFAIEIFSNKRSNLGGAAITCAETLRQKGFEGIPDFICYIIFDLQFIRIWCYFKNTYLLGFFHLTE